MKYIILQTTTFFHIVLCGSDWINLNKRGGKARFSKGLQGCSEGFIEGKAQGKFHAAALLARGIPRPSRLFYSDLHSFFNSIDPPKMHRRFRIILPKMHRGFLIGPPESVLALLSPYWPS